MSERPVGRIPNSTMEADLPRNAEGLRLGRMDADAVIDEIKHLPPGEQARVVEFVRTLETARPWSGEMLTQYERKMVATKDPEEALRLKEQIIAGFYGDEVDA